MHSVQVTSRDFMNIFCKRATGFHKRAKHFEVNFFIIIIRELSSAWSNQAGKIVLTASQFARWLALIINDSLE